MKYTVKLDTLMPYNSMLNVSVYQNRHTQHAITYCIRTYVFLNRCKEVTWWWIWRTETCSTLSYGIKGWRWKVHFLCISRVLTVMSKCSIKYYVYT